VKDAKRRILFAGGGTAGHLMPAINIALAMREIESECQPLFVGKRNGIEKNIVSRHGFAVEEIDVVPLRRTPLGVARFLISWKRACRQTSRILDVFRPEAVVGTGGYVSAPAMRMAGKRGIPLFIQEQNSLPGLATRFGAKYAETIFIAYDKASEYLDSDKCRNVGNPIRDDISRGERNTAYGKFGLDAGKNTLLVLGGSSGARSINEAIMKLARQRFLPAGWQLLWQTGKADYSRMAGFLESGDIEGVEIRSFIEDMPSAYAVADLVVSRAGAMALGEIAAVGLASILIPYPYAAGDHQMLNARILGDAGAAVVIPENEMGTKLGDILSRLFEDEESRKTIADTAHEMARPDAARNIAAVILDRIK
jgi:UDP-N-acetylglucosamine--N-acetylmuramyl-(pentapeptide) pyrophosphoryl-undecaprenol N-acetylglucosamine transferase